MAPANPRADRAPAGTALEIHRLFKAPRAKVYNAWVDAEALARWWGPEGYRAKVAALEVKPGGVYRTSMTGPDGVERWVGGVFDEVVDNEKLVFSWAWEETEAGHTGNQTRVTIEFRDAPGGTEVALTHELFQDVEQRDMHRLGWTSSLVCLAEVVGA